MLKRLLPLAFLIAAACEPRPPAAPPEPPPAASAPLNTVSEGMERPATAEELTPSLAGWDFAPLPVSDLGLTGTEDAAAVGALLQAKYGTTEPTEGAYSETLNVTETDAGALVLFTALNRMDDSVKSEQYLVEMFAPAATAAVVTGFGVRRQCWRGADPEAWTKDLCP